MGFEKLKYGVWGVFIEYMLLIMFILVIFRQYFINIEI